MAKRKKAELSIKEKIVFDYLLNYFKERGEMPSINEIGRDLNFSPVRASQIVRQLHKKGYLIKVEGKFHKAYLPQIEFLKGQNQQISQQK
jgi:Mn-dependent DtxR family transcriptional regulator